jgi:hypothetical protein
MNRNREPAAPDHNAGQRWSVPIAVGTIRRDRCIGGYAFH